MKQFSLEHSLCYWQSIACQKIKRKIPEMIDKFPIAHHFLAACWARVLSFCTQLDVKIPFFNVSMMYILPGSSLLKSLLGYQIKL